MYQEERKKTPVSKCVTPLDTGVGLIVLWSNMGERWNRKR